MQRAHIQCSPSKSLTLSFDFIKHYMENMFVEAAKCDKIYDFIIIFFWSTFIFLFVCVHFHRLLSIAKKHPWWLEWLKKKKRVKKGKQRKIKIELVWYEDGGSWMCNKVMRVDFTFMIPLSFFPSIQFSTKMISICTCYMDSGWMCSITNNDKRGNSKLRVFKLIDREATDVLHECSLYTQIMNE